MSETIVARKPLKGAALHKFLDSLTVLHGAHLPDGEYVIAKSWTGPGWEPVEYHVDCECEEVCGGKYVTIDGVRVRNRREADDTFWTNAAALAVVVVTLAIIVAVGVWAGNS